MTHRVAVLDQDLCQPQKIGFTVKKDYGDLNKAFVVVYAFTFPYRNGNDT